MIESEDFLLQQERKANQESNKLNFIQNEDDYKVKNITWPTIGDFTESLANKKIDEFIKKVFNIAGEVKIFLFLDSVSKLGKLFLIYCI